MPVQSPRFSWKLYLATSSEFALQWRLVRRYHKGWLYREQGLDMHLGHTLALRLERGLLLHKQEHYRMAHSSH